MANKFQFFECFALIKMTGRKAADIIEFIEVLRTVSPEAIFHHMHQYFLKPHVIPPEYPNDFAVWVSEFLGERSLAEGLANLNPYEFASIEDLRSAIIKTITDYLKSYPVVRKVLPGQEFFFNEGVTLVIPTGLEAEHMHEFVRMLKEVNNSSIYFHFYEARLRLGKKTDDFSLFLETCLECPSIALSIKKLDPYMYSTDELREKILKLMEEGI